jgi:hypothetical protein
MVGMAGFEPAASCSQISSAQSPDVAPRRLTWRSPGVTVAGRRSASPDDCARWLPLWLPPSAAQEPGSSLLNVTSNFTKRDQDAPVLATEPVKIADAVHLDVSSGAARPASTTAKHNRGAIGAEFNAAACSAPACGVAAGVMPLVRRLRMGSLLPGSWGAESRGWLLVPRYRSLRICPDLSPASTHAGHWQDVGSHERP